VSADDKQHELDELRERVRKLEVELQAVRVAETAWPPKGFYGAYYATAGAMLGMLAAAASLAVNVVGAPLAGRSPLELIKVYLTFPLGARALTLSTEGSGVLILTLGCCLYLATGMVLGVPLYFLLVRFSGGKSSPLMTRMIVASILSLVIWAIGFYGILSWLQPLLFRGNWIVDPAILPPWVAIGTHLVFGWTMALLYPLGLFTAYETPHAPEEC